MLSDYEDMIFKQLYCQLSNSDSDLHLLLEEIRKEDDRTPSYLRNVKELEDKSLLHMVVYGDEHEEIFNEGLTDYRWLVEEVTYKIGYSGETVLPYLTHINNKIVSVFSVNTPKSRDYFATENRESLLYFTEINSSISLFCLFPHFSHSGNHHFIVLNIILFHLLVFQRF